MQFTKEKSLSLARKYKALKKKENEFNIKQRQNRMDMINKNRSTVKTEFPNGFQPTKQIEHLPDTKLTKEKKFEIASTLYTLCPHSYRYLKQFIYLPSETTIRRRLSQQINERYNELQNVENIPRILRDWRIMNALKSNQNIVCVLSVDAVAFSPDVQLRENGQIIGFDLTHLEIGDTLQLYNESRTENSKWIQFVNKNWDYILTSAFIYYLQPINPEIDCLVVHFHMKTNGKATEVEKDLLLRIRRIIRKYHISIPSFAADGDSGYDNLHQNYFNAFFSFSLRNPFNHFSQKNMLMTICDPLHLLKRARYRLLKRCPPTASLKISNEGININKIQTLLRCQNIVFDNSSITKMHDILPIILFNPENLLLLLKKEEYSIAAYFFPWSFFIASLSNELNLSRTNRIELMEISFYYFIGYYLILSNTNLPSGLTETLSSKTIYLTLFDTKLLIHVICTLRTLIMILSIYSRQDISLNRCSSNPLEHLFGNLRVRCKFVHSLYRCLSKIAEDQIIQKMNITKEWKGIRRMTSFGAVVKSSALIDDEQLFSYEPKEIAFGILKNFGLEVPHESNQSISAKNYIECIIAKLTDLLSESGKLKKLKKHKFTMRQVTLGVTTNFKARNLTYAKDQMHNIVKVQNNNQYGIDKEKFLIIKRLLGPKILMKDLKSIIAETSSTFNIVINNQIRSKKLALEWIENHWEESIEIIARYTMEIKKFPQ